VPQRADKTVAAPTRQMPPRSTSSNAHQRVGVTASPRMQACGRRPQRLPDDHQQHESRVLLLDDCGPPDGWDGAPFTFVTEGVEAAVKQARDQAGNGVVGVAVTHLCYAVER
jgi:hypothetical protein